MTADIRVILRPEGVKDVINGMRQIRKESEALRRDTSSIADPFSRRGGFVNLFDKADAPAKKLGLTLDSIYLSATRLVPALGFAGAVSGMVSLGRNALKTASEVQDLNEQFRTTAEEITTLQFLARTNGSTNEDLERGLAGLAKSQRELAAGAEDTVAAYADLGLTARDFQGLNLAQSFELIAQRLQEIDPTRLNLDAVLGRNARRLIPSLNKLATEGFAKVREEGERLGAVLSGRSVNQTKQFSDQIESAGEALSGFGNTVTSNASVLGGPFVSGFERAIRTVTALLRLDIIGALRAQLGPVLRLFGQVEELPGTGQGGKPPPVDEAAQRQIIEANRKRSAETIKSLEEEGKVRDQLAAASIEHERAIAEARTVGNRDQIRAAQESLAAETQAQQKRLELATSSNRVAQNLVEVRYQTELQLARQSSASDAGFAARRVDIDRRAAQDRMKIAQGYYAELQRLESEALAQFRSAKEAQKTLENELLGIRRSADEMKFEGSIAGAGPVTQSIERERRALKQIQELRDAAARQDIERARQLRADIESQARTIGGLDTVGAGDVAQRVLSQANAIFEPLLQKQIEIEKQREASAKKSLADIQTQIQTVEQAINRLQERQVDLKLGIDTPSMQNLIQQIQSELRKTPFQIAVQATVSGSGSVPGFAHGGLLGGSSPSPRADNLLFRGTAGEFMQPVRAVQHYGLDFMESIRNLDFPRFADGGLLGGGGSAGSGPSDRMELSINIGGRRIGSVFGARDTVSQLASALQEVG